MFMLINYSLFPGPGREFSSLRDPSSNDNGFGDGNFNENKINSIGNGEGGMSKPHIPGHSGTINSYLDDTCLNCLTKCETEGRIFHDHISCQNECCPKGVFVEPYVRTAHEAPRPPNLFTYLHGA